MNLKSDKLNLSTQNRKKVEFKKWNKQSPRDLSNNNKRDNIPNIRLPDGKEKGCGVEKVFKEV